MNSLSRSLYRSVFFFFIPAIFIFLYPSFSYALDASIDGAIYGNPAGLARVHALENKLHNLTIKPTHPRIHFTPALLATAQARASAGNASWSNMSTAARTSTNIIDTAASALIKQTSDPARSASYATDVYNRIMADSSTSALNVSYWSLGFDWAYNSLTTAQRNSIANKIAAHTSWWGSSTLQAAYTWIAGGGKIQQETFYKQTWDAGANTAWPVIALAGYNTSEYLAANGRQMGDDAAYVYKSLWTYDNLYGDILRYYAYTNDYVPTEGYFIGAMGLPWFMDLRSATYGEANSVDIVGGQDGNFGANVGDYQLYAWDPTYNRTIFHKGSSPQGAGGVMSYSDTYPYGAASQNFNWKINTQHAPGYLLKADTNPYHNWMAKNALLPVATGTHILTYSTYDEQAEFSNIVNLLYKDSSLPATNPKTATYEQLPFAKAFPGAQEVYMRSSFGTNSVIAALRSSPMLTKTSHGDFDSNTFLIYRKGNLSMDSGVYDDGDPSTGHNRQSNYLSYQKNTVAHNNILVVDPTDPDGPLKIGIDGHIYGAPDPGGTDRIMSKSFGLEWSGLFTTPYIHQQLTDGGSIKAFDTKPTFDYAVTDSIAYGSRLSEYTRSAIFIRKPNDKAYFLIFDKLNATSPNYVKKWLIHLVNEPTGMGTPTSTEVASHIVNYSGNTFKSTNTLQRGGTGTAYNNSAIYGTVLLPKSPNIRKIGGTGYMAYVEGTTPTDYAYEMPYQATDWYGGKSWYMGGPLTGTTESMAETGQWRLELTNTSPTQRDYFLNVMYVGDDNETPAASVLISPSDSSRTGVHIQDATKNNIVILNKNKFATSSVDTFTYTATPTTTGVDHIITEVAASTVFNVTRNGSAISGSPFTSSNQGVLNFSTTETVGQLVTYEIISTGVVIDTSLPIISDFSMPYTATSLTVPVTMFTTTDNTGVTGYMITESFSAPSANAAEWNAYPPTSFTFSGGGSKAAHAWVKNAAGYVSASRSATVTITSPDKTSPTVTAFAIPSTSTSLTVSISTLTATDTVGVTGYLITESASAPAANASGWTASAPTSFTFSAAGTKTAYAWAKDAAGNVSASRSATLTITLDTGPLTNTLGQYNALTLNDKETITGTVNKNATLSVQVGSAAPLPVTVSPQGTWSFEVPNLVQGNNTIKVTAVDAAGKVTKTNITIKKLVSGDVNEDGIVDIRDVLIVLQAAVGAIQPTPEALVAGAVAGVGTEPGTSGISAASDRKLNIRDALGLLKISVGNKGT